MQNLTKEWKQLPVVTLQQVNFYKIFILCLWLRITRKCDQGVKFMNFSFTDIFFYFRFIWLWLLIAIMKRCAER